MAKIKSQPTLIGLPWNTSNNKLDNINGSSWKSSRVVPHVYLPKFNGKLKHSVRRITNELVSEISSALLFIIKKGGRKDKIHANAIGAVIKILLKSSSTRWDGSMVLKGEKWRFVNGNKGYMISSLGRVRSIKNNLLMRHNILPGKYHAVSICDNGVVKKIGVHILVLEAFKGRRPSPKHVGMHLDNNPQNNALNNLKWGTESENMQQALREGRWKPLCPPIRYGHDHHFSKPCFKYRSGKMVASYESINEACKKNGIPKTTLRRKMDNKIEVNGFLFTQNKVK